MGPPDLARLSLVEPPLSPFLPVGHSRIPISNGFGHRMVRRVGTPHRQPACKAPRLTVWPGDPIIAAMTEETIVTATPPEGWWLQTSVIYWDHMIVVDFLRLARVGALAPDSQTTIHAWLSCYRQAFELALKSLIRAAESKLFDRSYRDTGSEEPHSSRSSRTTACMS
jgi:hypothetical protein